MMMILLVGFGRRALPISQDEPWSFLNLSPTVHINLVISYKSLGPRASLTQQVTVGMFRYKISSLPLLPPEVPQQPLRWRASDREKIFMCRLLPIGPHVGHLKSKIFPGHIHGNFPRFFDENVSKFHQIVPDTPEQRSPSSRLMRLNLLSSLILSRRRPQVPGLTRCNSPTKPDCWIENHQNDPSREGHHLVDPMMMSVDFVVRNGEAL